MKPLRLALLSLALFSLPSCTSTDRWLMKHAKLTTMDLLGLGLDAKDKAMDLNALLKDAQKRNQAALFTSAKSAIPVQP